MAVVWNPIDWDSEGWRHQAACRRTDPHVFFPPGGSGAAISHIHAAKAVCRSCPVQTPCLQFALETKQEAGIWGGKNEEERRQLRSPARPGRR